MESFHETESPHGVSYRSEESTVEISDTTSSTTEAVPTESATDNTVLQIKVDEDNQFEFHISLRRLVLALGTLVAVGIPIIVLVLCSGKGHRVGKFEQSAKNSQESIVGTYNSVSGIIMAALARLLEMFLSMVIPVAMLTLATSTTLHTQFSFRYRVLALVATASIIFLIDIGLTALNVQPTPGKILYHSSDADIMAYVDTSMDKLTDQGENVNLTSAWISSQGESAPNNSIFNTILRTSLRTIDNILTTRRRTVSDTSSAVMPDIPSVKFGYTVRPWQSQLLNAGAPTNNTLTLNLDPFAELPGDDSLPMDGDTATDLFVRSMRYLAEDFSSGFWNTTNPNPFNLTGRNKTMHEVCGYTEDKNLTFNLTIYDDDRTKHIKVADCFNLTNATNEDHGFIAASVDRLREVFQAANISMSKGYSHVDYNRIQLAEDITFDSITIEFSRVISGSNGDQVVVAEPNNTNLSFSYPSAFPNDAVFAICSPNGCRDYAGSITDLDWAGKNITIMPFTRLARTCSDANESLLGLDYSYDDENVSFSYRDSFCNNGGYSNTSMLVYSLGKRIEGDLWDNTEYRMNITNFRFVYSFTVGRLSWKTHNLTRQFGASCNTTGEKCEGLSIPLDTGKDMLLVSSSKLPIEYMNVAPRDMWSISDPTYVYPDILLPRNFENVTYATHNAIKNAGVLDKLFAPYLFAVERNHLYIEQSLQVAYTVSLFYLFQNGVAVPILMIRTRRTASGWHFPGTSLAAILLLGKKAKKEIETGATTHVVAEARLNGAKYPMLLYSMTLGHTRNGRPLDQFDV
ncbi:hypothetical protein PHYPSEUDO_013290 [Phytophthora pseudosyringae]|uniref:Transmembrane protein n=1 Tax=Phytophthora pseudosyringae TaxID=221518 RepID=A0A8T1V8S3_9STRA|nr:hypothetical protein PHYPSEUDO_013290 [Phytophthora pseudosyringae]